MEKRKMKLAFIGRTEWLYNTARLMAERGYSIGLIVTAKEAPEYKKTATDFESLARDVGAEYLYSPSINGTAALDCIRGIAPDIALSMNYPSVVSAEAIGLFPHGILNAHGGDLPRYRGNACQAWAIINGEKRSAVCIHKMVGGELDSGDILARDYHEIGPGTKIGEIYRWFEDIIPQLYIQAVEQLETDPKFILEKQSANPADILRCYPRLPEDSRIDWRADSLHILRLVNASSEPYAGAFCDLAGEKCIVWDAELCEDGENFLGVPGQIAAIDKDTGYVVALTGRGKLKLKEIELNGDRCRPALKIKSLRARLK